MAADRRLVAPPVDDEVMASRLARNGLENCRIEQLVAVGGPERRPEIGCILLAEAHEERAGAGQRTRLQLSQKLWVSGVMKPRRPPVSLTPT